MHTLKNYLYVSALAPNKDASCIGAILKTARQFNVINGITGLLVFDGENFAQYIEGPPQAVDSLIVEIAKDNRHEKFSILAVQTLNGSRIFQSWAMGYKDVEIEQMDIESLRLISGADAVDLFILDVNLLDIQ
jgi:hypothetical protein